MAEPFRIVFILYPGVTQLDFTGPYEVLSRLPGVEAIVASKEGGLLSSETGLSFANLKRLADIDSCDMILAPGGPGQSEAMLDQDFMAQVKRLGEGARYVTAVCTGSLILAAAGLLKGRRAGTHWAYRDLLGALGAQVETDRVVRDGNAFTGGGVTAGIDIALTIAAEIAGERAAKMIQLSVEYAPAPPFNAGSPDAAEPEIVDNVKKIFAKFAEARRKAIARVQEHA
jgi:putative intracellular protease/amidase